MLDSMFYRPVGDPNLNGRFGSEAAVTQFPRPATIAPAGNQRGLSIHTPRLPDNLSFDATLDGRFSLGMLGTLVVALGLFYIWTRNVQGG